MQNRSSVRGLRKNGTEFPIEVTISKIHIDQNIEMTAVIRDISEKNKLIEELLISSQEDPLTNLYNRRYFSKVLTNEIIRYKRFKHSFVLMMLDIDHFKNFNDEFGHDCGDYVLKHLASLLKFNFRETDIISRWGGEEFLILLPEIDFEAGKITAENIRSVIENTEFVYDEKKLFITVSIGVKAYKSSEIDMDGIIKEVDKALYKAKLDGRNRVSSGL